VTTKASDQKLDFGGGSNRGRHICIVGAGIGGLTAALAFAQRGAKVQVLEQAAEITAVGAGIQITPNGARVLQALGLGKALAQAGLCAQAVVPMDGLRGRQIARFDLSDQDPSYRFFHRAALIEILAKACRTAGVEIALDRRVLGVSTQGVVEMEHGRAAFDLCVGADGVHSVCRSAIAEDEPATFTGQVAWRAIVPATHMTPREARIWMLPGRHVVTYPISDHALNVVAVEERKDWAQDGWNHADDPVNLRAAFADAGSLLTRILKDVEDTHLWGLFRYPVARNWYAGRTAILGDAAHPTLLCAIRRGAGRGSFVRFLWRMPMPAIIICLG